MSPSPNRKHQEICGNLYRIIGNHLAENPAQGKVFVSPLDVTLTDHDVFQPDLFFVGSDRLSILTDEGAEGAPTLIIEILSKSTASHDQSIKKQIYTQCDVMELWLVDPDRNTIEVFRLQDNPESPLTTVSAPQSLTSSCLPGLEINLDLIFP